MEGNNKVRGKSRWGTIIEKLEQRKSKEHHIMWWPLVQTSDQHR